MINFRSLKRYNFMYKHMVTMKMLFQTVCTTSMNWDDKLKGKTLASWNSFVGDLNSMNYARVASCYFHCVNDSFRTHKTHGFCDASDLPQDPLPIVHSLSGITIKTVRYISKKLLIFRDIARK